ncbi:hypothetical protein ACIQ9K_38730 [Streptomyces microflavus]|uniref:hypothetical protein n=1 Tax=Streptomyces microflavus TaxID=1919 RepID=UPI00382DD14F
MFGFKTKARKLQEKMQAELDSGEGLEAPAVAVQLFAQPSRLSGTAQAWRGIVSFVTDDGRQTVIGSAQVQEVRAGGDGTYTILLAPSAPYTAIEVAPAVHHEKWLTIRDQVWRPRSQREQ